MKLVGIDKTMSEIYWNTWVPLLLFAHAKEFSILPYKGFTKRDTRTYLVFPPQGL